MSDFLYKVRPNRKSTVDPIKVRFRDLDCDFRVYSDHLDLLVNNDLAIYNQIKNLLSTPTQSEDFESSFGSNIPFRIQEPIGTLNSALLEMDTIIAISTWMSDRIRVVLPGSTVIPLTDEDGYYIELPYIKIGSNEFGVFKVDILR